MKLFKYTIFTLAILAVWLAAADSAWAQSYQQEGTFVSSNLLASSTDVSLITGFTATTTIPATTSIQVQFSKNGVIWYNASGSRWEWETLASGTNYIDLSALHWEQPFFRYKVKLATNDASTTPELLGAEVEYSDTESPPADYYAEGSLVSANLLASSTDVELITSVSIQASVPATTTARVQFSRSGVVWYDSGGTQWGSEALSDGENSFDLSGLGWDGSYFYYKLYYTTASSTLTPEVTSAEVVYSDSSQTEYDHTGILESGNVLASPVPGKFISGFGYDLSELPAGTAAYAKFSRDGSAYYSATGTPAGWSRLEAGNNLNRNQALNLTSLGWTAEALYYKIKFVSSGDNSATPELSEIQPHLEERPTDPAAHWSFDSPSAGSGQGGTVYDETGGDNGLVNGDPEQYSESMCAAGKCLLFDGGGDYVSATGTSINRAQTVNFWARAASSDTYFINLATSTHIYASGGRIQTAGLGSPTIYVDGSRTNQFTANRWHMVSVVMDTHVSADELYFGRADGNYFAGFLDELKIYPYARSADEIKADYAAGQAGVSSAKGVSASFGWSSDNWMSDGLVGYWKFDESATTSGAVDSSGNGNDGTYYGNASTSAGKFGNGYVGSGAGDDRVLLDETSVYDDLSNGSVAAWVKWNANSGFEEVFSMISSNREFEVAMSDNDKFEIWTDTGCSGGQLNAEVTLSNPSAWHHIVYTNDENGNKMYVDGKVQEPSYISGSATQSTFFSNCDFGTSYYHIGAVYNTSMDPVEIFDGQIDEVRVYNRALSQDEVKKLYEWAPGPVAHWDFDEYEGQTVYDKTGNGNDGTLVNGPEWVRGKYGGALEFDGTPSGGGDAYVDLGSDNQILYGTEKYYTLCAWIYLNAEADLSTEHFIYWAHGDSGTLEMLTSAWNQDRWGIYTYNNGWNEYYDSPRPLAKKWEYLCFLRDNDDVRLYQNGVYAGGGSGYIEPDYSGSITQAIGRSQSEQDSFDGKIDEMKIYNYARSQKQILEDMQGSSPSAGSGRSLNSTVLSLDFDEGYGETAHDKSGFDNHGTLYPGTSGDNTATSAMWTLDGKVGKALEFDGVDDRIAIANFQFPMTNQFSISHWINWQTLATGKPVLAQWGDSQNSILLQSDDTDSDELRICIASGLTDSCTNYAVTKDANLGANNWYHIQVSYNGDESADADQLKLYINAEAKDLTFVGDIPNSGTDSSEGIEIGGDADIGGYADILIDQVKIWNYALSKDEVETVYNQGKSAVLGSGGADSSGNATDAASGEYCVPGDTSQCDSPVGEWKFDEKAGQTAYDTSGNGNDGTLEGGPQWTRGKFGAGLKFDGSDDYVSFDSMELDIVTISGWIKMFGSGDSSYPRIIDMPGFQLHINSSSNNTLNFVSERATTFGGWSTPDNSISEDRWHYIAAVYNEASVDNDPKIYIDGVSQSVSEDSTPEGDPIDNQGTGNIGDDINYVRHFQGIIDDVNIYDYARTPAQIAWEYNKGKPIAHWRMDEGERSVVHDDSGNDNHGTLHLGSSGNTSTSSAWTVGKLNDGMDFDGTDDYVDISDNSVFDFGNNTDFSIGAWVKSEGGVNDQLTILSKGDNSGVSGRIIFKVYDDTDDAIFITAGSGNDCDGSIDVLDGNWHYVLLEADRDGNLIGYVDGEVDCTSGSSNDQDLDTDINVQIGRSWDGTSDRRYFDGIIDEVKVWNYGLTPEQVKQEYNGGVVRFE